MYEVEAMQHLSPTSASEQVKEREMYEQSMDDSLAKCKQQYICISKSLVSKQAEWACVETSQSDS
jgi:hypothetical protein